MLATKHQKGGLVADASLGYIAKGNVGFSFTGDLQAPIRDALEISCYRQRVGLDDLLGPLQLYDSIIL